MAKILIVDDDKPICDMVCKFVSKMGHEPVYALTGEEGIRLATAEKFDIIFLDVGLPDCNGLSLLTRQLNIRLFHPHPDPPPSRGKEKWILPI